MVPVNDASGSKHLNTLLFCNLGLQFSATKPPKRSQLKSTKDPTHLKCSPAMRCSKCIAILGRLVHNKQPDQFMAVAGKKLFNNWVGIWVYVHPLLVLGKYDLCMIGNDWCCIFFLTCFSQKNIHDILAMLGDLSGMVK